MQTELPRRSERVELDAPQCPQCGLELGVSPGTEDSEVLEIEVQAYRRVIRRQRYHPRCTCGCVPGIVSAPAPARLIERGKFGVSVWTTVLLDKFLYGRPSHRLIEDLGHRGLQISAGTRAGGLQAIAPMFVPLDRALALKLRSQSHWHADETRWAVFADVAGKVGHRWCLWVFHSSAVVHYVLDESRSADVIQAELVGVEQRTSVMKILSELGPDLSRFANMKHFCSWLGLCPATKISGGKVMSASTKRSANRVRQALKMAAMSLSRSQSALGAFYRRLCGRMDKPRANTATAHKLARMVYFMLTRGEAFVDQGQQRYEEQQRQRSIAALKRRAAALGFQVTPTGAAA